MRSKSIIAGVILSLLLAPVGAALADPSDAQFSQAPYQLQVSPAEARATLNAYLRYLELRAQGGENPDDHAIGQVSRLVRSYRSSRFWETTPLKDAPYPGAIIYSQAPGIWSGLFESEWRKAYDQNVVHVSLETLFDAFMNLYINDQLPASIKSAGDAIGKCLARKVMRAADPQKCPLDLTDATHSPSLVQLLWAKTTCGINTPPACYARRVVYDKAKPDLIKFRTDPQVQALVAGEFGRRFPEQFQSGFLDQMSQRMAGFPQLINDKFRGEFNTSFWGPATPLIESLEDPRTPDATELKPQPNRKLTLKGFASGLRADLGVAQLFEGRDSKYLRGLAAPLFYASANRLLMMTGGTRASWNGTRFETLAPDRVGSFKIALLPDLAKREAAGHAGDYVYVTGRRARLVVEVLDRNGGHLPGYVGTVRITAPGVAGFPQSHTFSADLDKGTFTVPINLPVAGDMQVTVVDNPNVASGRGTFTIAPGFDPATVLAIDPVYVPTAPMFKPQRFGGWSSVVGANQTSTYNLWDWSTYDPLTPGNPIQLFSSELLLGPAGVPLEQPSAQDQSLLPAQRYEDIDSMAALIQGVADFLKYTRPGTPLSKYLGDASNVSDVLEPGKPMIFPKEGRMLAIGTLAGVLKNFVAPRGHVEQTQAGVDPTWPLGIAFFDKLTHDGRAGNAVPVQAVGRLIIAASRLYWDLDSDPDVPKELKDLLPQLVGVVQIGGLTLGAKGQEPDGGFRELLDVPQAQGRSLRNTILGLRAVTYAHMVSNMLVYLVRVKNGWEYIDKAWGDGDVPKFEDGPNAAPTSPSELWDLVNLWEETQDVLKSHPHTQLDWPKWEHRFEMLTTLLKNQLATDHGPVSLSH